MPIAKYGIYLAYGPTVDLRKEGLGRVLADFLRAASVREDVQFVIGCPEWLQPSIRSFFESENIPGERFPLISARGVPLALRLYLAARFRRRRPRASRWQLVLQRLRAWAEGHRRSLEYHAFSTRSIIVWVAIVAYAGMAGAALSLVHALAGGWRKFRQSISTSGPVRLVRTALAGLLQSGGNATTIRWYRLMEEAEAARLLAKIRTLKDVRAWYCPTAFWPSFNQIQAPRLMCVPDVLPITFPAGFATLNPELIENFEIIQRSIRGGTRFLTYSDHVKWSTLVDHYSVAPEAIRVIPHASCNLRSWIQVHGINDAENATREYSEVLVEQALRRLGRTAYQQTLNASSLRFIFYASQFRPNKNILLLLYAYRHLLREQYIHHKLLLTGEPSLDPAVQAFIERERLGNDVICLHGMTTPELAACYHLADLAVNPSLAEGGCPFTLTEALSVDTPVIMARIPVTEERIVDEELRNKMLFDPYDWRKIAAKIEWALANRDELLKLEQRGCSELCQRSWSEVVDECVAALDRAALEGATA
jgi:glycosyltransferase involved in cell wall biosynthesis